MAVLPVYRPGQTARAMLFMAVKQTADLKKGLDHWYALAAPHNRCPGHKQAASFALQQTIQWVVSVRVGYLVTPPDSSAKRLFRASSSPKAVKQLLTTDAR